LHDLAKLFLVDATGARSGVAIPPALPAFPARRFNERF